MANVIGRKSIKPEDIKEDLINKFNSDLFWLVKILKNRNPKDVNILRLIDILALARKTDREILLVESGPYLVKYQESIRENTIITTFTEDKLTQESSRAKKKSDKEFVLTLFGIIQQQINSMTKKEIDIIHQKINDMLDTYLDFLIAEKRQR